MPRTVPPIPTVHGGVEYRSRTEARWAVFFDTLGVSYAYENELIRLSSGQQYLPDFYVTDFQAYLEVKPNSDEVVTEESAKALCLARDRSDRHVWLAAGPPDSELANVLPLDLWPASAQIGDILSAPENRYRLLEDRRDDSVYWLHSEYTDSSFHHSYMVGGPGVSTDHERLPLMRNRVERAYQAARGGAFGQ